LLDRFDPWQLASDLAIPVWALTDLVDEAAVGHLLEIDRSAFSAVTVFYGTRRAIVHNDAHALERQASDVAHELAHGLLLHVPTEPLADGGIRAWNGDAEEEAQYLAGALLVTEEAALYIVRGGMDVLEAAFLLGVSGPMLQYRLNVTGARKRVARGSS